MGKVILITGGARSGKSDYAQRLAEQVPGQHIFIATCVALDPELEERIAKHKESRRGRGWKTIEEPLELEKALAQVANHEVVLVDCLTLWVNNLISGAGENAASLTEQGISDLCRGVLERARSAFETAIFVTNEVGMGIVPDNELARKYRDLLGRCNQVFAKEADEVILMVSGIPVPVKPNR